MQRTRAVKKLEIITIAYSWLAHSGSAVDLGKKDGDMKKHGKLA